LYTARQEISSGTVGVVRRGEEVGSMEGGVRRVRM
jgi:hypothetical protein